MPTSVETAASTPSNALNTVVCDLCNTSQTAPDNDLSQWRCRMCGQEYRGGAAGKSSIVLSERQLAALRTQAGRDASGNSTLITNWWTANDQPAGETFLDWHKEMPARQMTRKMICDWAAAGEISTVLEIAFGGLHEYRALRAPLKQLGVTYSGVDWTKHFVEHAQKEFPENRWTQGDIVRGVSVDPADVVYSQHMLEHICGLEPAFSNMLRLAKKRLINIFFIPPKGFDGYEVVNWKQYPLYHNTYSVGHIEHVCRANGFKCNWSVFPVNNPALGETGIGQDVVLVAERV